MKGPAPFIAAGGRIVIAALFLMSGLGKLGAPVATQGYIATVGLPFPLLGYAIAILAEVGCGFFLLIGYRTSIVAAFLAVFTLATAVFFHNNFTDQNQMIHFLKNVMIIGGLLQLVAFGAPALSLDARRASARPAVAA